MARLFLTALVCLSLGWESALVAASDNSSSTDNDETTTTTPGGDNNEVDVSNETAGSNNEVTIPKAGGSNDTTTTTPANGATPAPAGSTPTPSPTSVEPTTTTFTAVLRLNNVADFKVEDYLKSIAASTDVPEGNVEVVSVTYKMEAKYEAQEDIPIADWTKGLAVASGLPETGVIVTAARRLSAFLRRLATAVAATLSTTDGAKATAAFSNIADVARVSEGLKSATSGSVSSLTITSAPVLGVEVVTKIKSDTNIAVQAPTGSEIAAKYAEIAGVDVGVVVSEGDGEANAGIPDFESNTTTTVVIEEQESSAVHLSSSISVVAISMLIFLSRC